VDQQLGAIVKHIIKWSTDRTAENTDVHKQT